MDQPPPLDFLVRRRGILLYTIFYGVVCAYFRGGGGLIPGEPVRILFINAVFEALVNSFACCCLLAAASSASACLLAASASCLLAASAAASAASAACLLAASAAASAAAFLLAAAAAAASAAASAAAASAASSAFNLLFATLFISFRID